HYSSRRKRRAQRTEVNPHDCGIAGALFARQLFADRHAMKVLLVEDNERVARFVKKGLIESGHTVDHADNGRDGMFLAAGEPYDAIIMDRRLPGDIEGLGIIAALRKSGSKVPILILSALGDVDERIRGLKSGGDDY